MGKLKSALLVAVMLAGGALCWLYWSLNSLVQRAVERFGPELTKTTVRLADVKLSPFSGYGSLRGFVLGNPQGFKSKEALRVERVYIDLDLKSLATDVIHVRKVYIKGPEVTFEAAAGGSNLARIQRNVETAVPSSKPAAKRKGPEKKIIIDRVDIVGGKAHLAAAALGGELAAASMPDLHLRDIGKKSGGTTAREALGEILRPLTRSATGAAGNIGQTVDQVVDQASRGIEQAFKGLLGGKKR